MGQYVTRREFKLLRDMLDERHRADQQGVAAALSAAKEAVNKAELAAEKRFEGVNEFRAQLSDQAATFMPRAEYDTAHGALVEKMQTATDTRAREIADVDRRLTAGLRDLATRFDTAAARDVGVNQARDRSRTSLLSMVQLLGLVTAVVSVALVAVGIYLATR